MSKLAKLVQRVVRREPAPIGFGLGARKTPPTMLLVALASDHAAQHVRDAVDAGADALLLAGRLGEREMTDVIAAAGGKPVGLVAPDTDATTLARLRQEGVDFVSLDAQAPATALLDEELGYLLSIHEELTDIQLRTLEALPLTALHLGHESRTPTIRHQMELQRLSGLARTPLLVSVRLDAPQEDLLCLRESGVALVAIDMKERGAVEAVRRLRDMIDGLPPRRRADREERRPVSLPGAAAAGSEDDEDEDEED